MAKGWIGQRLDRWATQRLSSLGDEMIAQAKAAAETVATAVVKQSAPSIGGVDPDDALWRSVANWRSRRDLVPLDQDRLIEVANYICQANPLAKRIRELRRDFVIGEGCTIEAEDKKVIQPLFDEFMADPVNNWDEYQEQLVDFLAVNGELYIPAFVNDYSGAVTLGWIDPILVERVIGDKRNCRIMRTVILKYGAGPGATDFYAFDVQREYSIINKDTEPRSPTYGYRVGDIFQFKINAAPDGRRGRSDFESIADWVDAWDQASFNDLERSGLMLNFIWDVTMNDLTQEEIETRLSNMQPPKPGSVRGHNQNVTWQAVAPDLKLMETRKLATGIRDDILGAAGLSSFYFGISESTNRAGSDNLEVPILKGLTNRQKKVKAFFHEIFDYAIDRMCLKRPVIKRMIEDDKISRKFSVKMPEISVKDLSKIGAVLTQVATGIDLAQERGWVSSEMAAQMFQSFMSQFDFVYDPLEEMGKAKKEKEANANSDYTPETMGKLLEMAKGAPANGAAQMIA